MGRILAVIVSAYISCVLCSSTNRIEKEKKCDLNSTTLFAARNDMNTCFKDVVQVQIDGSTKPRACTYSSDFGKSMIEYGNKIKKQCNATVLSEKFLEFVDFSLKKFKEFYTDVECFKSMEPKISQCVKDNVGYFNITKTKMHSSWMSKIMVTYDDRTCPIAREVKNCTVDVLKACKPTTSQYVESLFDFSLKNCNNSSNQYNEGSNTGSLQLPLLTIAISLTALMINSISI